MLFRSKPLYIEGYLKTRSWENPETKAKHSRTEIVIDEIIFLGQRDDAEEAEESAKVPAKVARAAAR